MYRRLLVLALGTFAVGTDSFVIAGVLPEVSGSLHVSTSAAGQLITAYALAYALLSPVMATATAHWPRRTVLLSGLAVFVAGTAGSALLPSYAAVLVCRAVAGLGGAMVVPTAGGVGAGMVPAAQRGRSLAVVLAGLTAATALGAPLGTALAAVSGWRVTMVGVALLGLLAALGVATLLPPVPTPPPMALRARLAPVRDRRIASALATTVLAYAGLFSVYSYIAVVFHRATGGSGRTLAVLLLVWGIAATAGNLGAGHLADRFGSRRVINAALVIAVADFALLRWTTSTIAGAVIVLVVWGLAGWGLLVAQQHRLVAIAPSHAPVLIGLNSSAVYVAVSASGVIGAAFLVVGLTVTGLSPHGTADSFSAEPRRPAILPDAPVTPNGSDPARTP